MAKDSRAPIWWRSRYLLCLVLALSLVWSGAMHAATSQRASAGQATPSRVGQITEYPLPKGYGEPWAITTGPDGNLWFTVDGPSHGQNYAGRFNPHTEQISTYAIPGCSGPPPTGIVSGPDGNMWVMGGCGSLHLARIHPRTGQVQLYSWQFNGSGRALTVGPDGNLWLADEVNDTIDRFSLTDHSLTQYPIPTQGPLVTSLITGPDGNLWFTEFDGHKIGRLDPKTGQFSEYPLLYQNEGPQTITPGPRGDRHLWFVTTGRLGWIDPFTGQMMEVTTPLNEPLWPGLSAGPDGNLWLSVGGKHIGTELIVRATPSATLLFSAYRIPTPRGQAEAITAGPDGNMWFTELYNNNHFGNKIGRITTH